MEFLFGSLLLIAAIQDFNDRKVNVWVLLMTAVIGMAYFLQYGGQWVDLFLNVTYVSLLIGLILVFARVTKRELQQMIGYGDLLYFATLVFWFPFTHFVYLMPFSFIGAFFIHLVFSVFRVYGKQRTIPLITCLAPFHFTFLLVI